MEPQILKMEDGLTMKYTVKGGEIFFSRNEENVTKAAVIRAFHHARQLQRDSGPEELESSVGCYLYSVFLRIGVFTYFLIGDLPIKDNLDVQRRVSHKAARHHYLIDLLFWPFPKLPGNSAR